MDIQFGAVRVSWADGREWRHLSARLRGRPTVYRASHSIPSDRLHRSAEPDKIRHHIDNRMRNEITDLVLRDNP